ncbi:MAG TPA: hypothetical protein VHB69_09465 [Mycobacteriales bacterium]|nr:hypothetical protein [Mycobacteriales bacterium]
MTSFVDKILEVGRALAEARIEHAFGGRTIPIVSATDLSVLKALFDRPKDWVEIGEMLAYGEVDAGEVRTWMARVAGAKDRRVAKWDAMSST